MGENVVRQASIQAAIDAGRELGEGFGTVRMVDSRHRPFILVKNAEGGLEVRGLDELALDRPKTVRRVITLHDQDGFSAYVNAFKLEGRTRIYGDRLSGRVSAVLDDHKSSDPADASWCDHRAVLLLADSPQWAAWRAHDGEKMAQVEFAEFLEDRVDDIIEPAGAQMLEIAMRLEAAKSADFRSAIRLDSGQVQFRYEENVKAQTSAGGEEIKIPTMIKLRLPVYFGGQEYEIDARFRYRLSQGGLALFYKLGFRERLELDAFRTVAKSVGETTGIPVWLAAEPERTGIADL